MPIEPVKIPQNVYIEDRIVGPLTLKQIIISMLGMGFSYAIWASIQKVQGYVPIPITVIVWIPGALAVIFSFVKINDLSLTHLLFLMIERMNKPQTRVYGPRRGISVNTLSFAAPNPNARKIIRKDEQPAGDISRLSAFLDHEGVRPMSLEHGEENDERQYAQEEEPAAVEQGSSIPARPVQKDRVKVSPLQTSEIADLKNENGKELFRDIFHPPASHA